MDPTLPQIIKKANNSLLNIPTVGVTPKLKPTVAMAEAVSNRAVTMGIPSTAEISTADKSIFKHEPKGRAAETYRNLVKEVMDIGEKQRSTSADLGR